MKAPGTPRSSQACSGPSPTYAREICESAIQVHGGIGFTWEYGLHLYYRRILSLQSMLGGALDAAAQAGRAYMDAG